MQLSAMTSAHHPVIPSVEDDGNLSMHLAGLIGPPGTGCFISGSELDGRPDKSDGSEAMSAFCELLLIYEIR
jgi:hypothetical protein